VVNDGSTDHTRIELDTFAESRPWITVIHRERNGGKGAAVKDAVRCALAQGYTHLLQLDADGQHDATVAPQFFSAAQKHPTALIIGRPLFDSSAPLVRRLGREISNALLWLQTLSFCARDVLCGYRCYPIADYGEVLLTNVTSNRMEFDPEAVVRLYWAGASVINIPTKVSYPLDGLSHFRYAQDNLMIARLHARLLAGMVLRAPRLVRRALAL
jgi:glycosyltransferase involved in cell wall biosynthesis